MAHHNPNYNMEEIDALLDLPSPSNSQYYVYGDGEAYLDNTTSESQSPVDSPVRILPSSAGRWTRHAHAYSRVLRAPRPNMMACKKYDMSFVPDMGIPNIYPSPQSSNGDGESSQAAGAAKAPAKRKRENRYKNAPPSVLSVSLALVAPMTCRHHVRDATRMLTPNSPASAGEPKTVPRSAPTGSERTRE